MNLKIGDKVKVINLDNSPEMIIVGTIHQTGAALSLKTLLWGFRCTYYSNKDSEFKFIEVQPEVLIKV